MNCPHCGEALSAEARFCPSCGGPAAVSDVTTLSPEAATRAAGRGTSGSGSQTGWLTSSGPLDHGRFGPGTVLEGRYRVIGLLGRGGMGEVYRADDLRLGQAVALKFLPVEWAGDPQRLAQLHNEVRTARHVSHPNVCRVYDIGEMEGQLFITMEYVDGEDLSILLRRIGRLPEDKGLEIARQLCAGLAAAHDRGVLHRDLKPANIMLDGAGRVRIMDFSLAAAGEVTEIRAGTPAYMAPEQLGGQDVTVRSDIYALGLVLYELFTGRRAFDAASLSELVEQHQSGNVTAPTTVVKGLDPAIEGAILRCLDPNPARRPSSALRVSASLPGGDPLAAAIAAGQTPSPEMVAAAGDDRAAISLFWGAAWFAAAVAIVLAVAGLMGRTSVLARVAPTKPAAVLQDRAEQMREAFGYSERVVDRASGFMYDTALLQWVSAHRSGPERWSFLPSARPAAVRYWHRTSPTPIVPVNQAGIATLNDPPVAINGMTLVMLDTMGRLQRFEAAPAHVEPEASAPAPPVDWGKLFAAAGLDQRAFSEVTPPRTPPGYADERKAWAGMLPGTDVPVTIDAAGYRGRPTLFDIVPEWRQPSREPEPPASPGSNPIYVYILIGGAALAAYSNVRRGRADKRGAFVLAAFMFVLLGANWVVAPHVANLAADQQRFFVGIGIALFVGSILFLLYLGLEPFVRRIWPAMLIGWSRLLRGQIRDPLVGREVLLGVLCGAVLALANVLSTVLPARFGWPEPVPPSSNLASLMGFRPYLGTVIGNLNSGLQNALINAFQFVVLRAAFEWAIRGAGRWSARRWTWAARRSLSDRALEWSFFLVAVPSLSLLLGVTSEATLAEASYAVLSTALVLLVLLRAGILAATVMFFVNITLVRIPLTLASDTLYTSASWLTLAGVVGLAAAGLWVARTEE